MMRLFNGGSWAVVMATRGHRVFLEDTLTHEAMAVAHWPQINAATIKTGLSEKAARKEAQRLNRLNDPIVRMMRVNDYQDAEPLT